MTKNADDRLRDTAPELLDILEAIVAMQALRYGDGMRTHMALIGLCVTAREVISKARNG